MKKFKTLKDARAFLKKQHPRKKSTLFIFRLKSKINKYAVATDLERLNR